MTDPRLQPVDALMRNIDQYDAERELHFAWSAYSPDTTDVDELNWIAAVCVARAAELSSVPVPKKES